MAEIKQYEISTGNMNVRVYGLQASLDILTRMQGRPAIKQRSDNGFMPLDISRIGGF